MKISNIRNLSACLISTLSMIYVFISNQAFLWSLISQENYHLPCSSLKNPIFATACAQDLETLESLLLSSNGTTSMYAIGQIDEMATNIYELERRADHSHVPCNVVMEYGLQLHFSKFPVLDASDNIIPDLYVLRSTAMGMYGFMRSNSYMVYTHSSLYAIQTVFEGEDCVTSDAGNQCNEYHSSHFVVGESSISKFLIVFVLSVTLGSIRLLKLFQKVVTTELALSALGHARKVDKVLRVSVEDLLFSNRRLKFLSILSTVFGTLVLIQHYEDWAASSGFTGFLHALHLIDWAEGITSIVDEILCRMHKRSSCTGVFFAHLFVVFILLPIFTTCITQFSRNDVVDTKVNVYVGSMLNHVIAVIAFSISLVISQYIVALIVNAVVEWEIRRSGGGAQTGKSDATSLHRSSERKSKSNQVSPLTTQNFLSTFEVAVEQNVLKFFGYCPVTPDHLCYRGMEFIPTEWIMACNFRIIDGYLVKNDWTSWKSLIGRKWGRTDSIMVYGRVKNSTVVKMNETVQLTGEESFQPLS